MEEDEGGGGGEPMIRAPLLILVLLAACSSPQAGLIGTSSGSSTTSGTSASSSSSGSTTGSSAGSSSSGSSSTGGSTSGAGSTSGTGTSGWTTGASLDFYVNGDSGIDSSACGPTIPCLTITQAMSNVGAQNALGAIIHVNVDSTNPVVWPPLEPWPVTLGFGVTLLAADNIYFTGPSGSGRNLFAVTPSGVPSADALVVTIGSTAAGAALMSLGFDLAYDGSGTSIAVEVRDMTVQLSCVELSGTEAGILVDGTTPHLIFGPCPTYIDGWSNSSVGLSVQAGEVTDTGFGNPVLSIAGPNSDMIVQGGTVVFSQPIVLGPDPDPSGSCPAGLNNFTGLTLNEGMVMLLGGAAVHCHLQDGLAIPSGTGQLYLGNDGGTVTGAQSSVELSGCAGIWANAGYLIASNTLFRTNRYGVIQRASGVAGIGTGSPTPNGSSCPVCTGNTVACNTAPYLGTNCLGNGRDLWANSALTLHAEGASLGANGPAYYVCQFDSDGQMIQTPSQCTCSGSACVALASGASPPDGAQAISSPSSTNLVDATGASMTFGCP
jgi:hypothetical protein